MISPSFAQIRRVRVSHHVTGSVKGKKQQQGESESSDTILQRLEIEGYDAEREKALNAAQTLRDKRVADAARERDEALMAVRKARDAALQKVLGTLKAEQVEHKQMIVAHQDELVPAALAALKYQVLDGAVPPLGRSSSERAL